MARISLTPRTVHIAALRPIAQCRQEASMAKQSNAPFDCATSSIGANDHGNQGKVRQSCGGLGSHVASNVRNASIQHCQCLIEELPFTALHNPPAYARVQCHAGNFNCAIIRMRLIHCRSVLTKHVDHDATPEHIVFEETFDCNISECAVQSLGQRQRTHDSCLRVRIPPRRAAHDARRRERSTS